MACHVSCGNADFDFPAGTVTATTIGEEIALNLVVASIAEALRIEYSAIETKSSAPSVANAVVDSALVEGLLTPEEIARRAGEGRNEGTAN